MKGIANAQGLPFPIPHLKFLEQCKRMKIVLDSLVDGEVNRVLHRCETLLENGTMTNDALQSDQVKTLAGEAFEWIAEKAQKETQWKRAMVPVINERGTPIWVKGDYQKHYRVFG